MVTGQGCGNRHIRTGPGRPRGDGRWTVGELRFQGPMSHWTSVRKCKVKDKIILKIPNGDHRVLNAKHVVPYVMVRFMCQLEWAMGCPGVWSNIIL